ncbi:helix-turn-helix domain-containing protein, partial [Bacillus thuringiensis]
FSYRSVFFFMFSNRKHVFGMLFCLTKLSSYLSLEEMLFVTLKYLRQYPTMKELAFEYNVAESTIHRSITWVEDTLIRSRKFTLKNWNLK